jgi:hypothetical protein
LREIGYSTQVEFKWALINPIMILVAEHWSGLQVSKKIEKRILDDL